MTGWNTSKPSAVKRLLASNFGSPIVHKAWYFEEDPDITIFHRANGSDVFSPTHRSKWAFDCSSLRVVCLFDTVD